MDTRRLSPHRYPGKGAAPVKRIRWLRGLIIASTFAAFAGAGLFFLDLFLDRRGPLAPTEIFQGITYGCEQLEVTSEGSGLLHWVRVDLTAPGISLYVTPLDLTALLQGWQYRLRRIGEVVDREHLAIAINASLFVSNSLWKLRLPGDLARGVETVVADHVASHVWEHTYLLWFDDHLTPHLNLSKPPAASDLARAKWGVGGQGVALHNGQLWPGDNLAPDSRTAIAIDPERRLLFLAVGENISPRLILQKLADYGAKDGMLLDSGSSSAMAIGQGAAGIRPGVVYSGWRPVATYFGVRAQPIGKLN